MYNTCLPGRTITLLLLLSLFVYCNTSKHATTDRAAGEKWISLFNGKDLTGWTPTGVAQWKVIDGVLTGEGGRGHIYADPVSTNFEIRGELRITNKGKSANSGLYFRANPPADNPDGFPKGYEAQICNDQDAFTGWLWKPGTPTGKASVLLTKDGEWFAMRVKAEGSQIQIWVKDQLVTNHTDTEYVTGKFAIQCHNEDMLAEARDLYYRPLP